MCTSIKVPSDANTADPRDPTLRTIDLGHLWPQFLEDKPLSQEHLVLALVVSYASKSSRPHTASLPSHCFQGLFPT